MREVFLVENIKCHGCTSTITAEIKKLDATCSVTVNPEDGMVEVESNEPIHRDSILDKLKHLGYPEASDNNVLHKAKSYVSCMVGRLHPNDASN